MYIVHVAVQVKGNKSDNFVNLVGENRRNSLKEEVFFNSMFFKKQSKKNHFLIIEKYHSQEDQAKFRETDHFSRFKEAVPDLVEKPYSITNYDQVFN